MKTPSVYCIVIGVLLAITGCRNTGPEPGEIASAITERLLDHRSMSYDINYRIKYFSEEDTVQVDAQCILIREPSDTIFGGMIWYYTSDSAEKLYNLEHIFAFNHRDQKITTYDPHQGQDWAMTGNAAGSVIRVYFLEPEKLTEAVNDTSNIVSATDTVLNGKSLHRITISYPDDPPVTDCIKSVFIEKDKGSIVRVTFRGEFQNQFQYNEWNLSNIEFDKYDRDNLMEKLNSRLESYLVEQYVGETEEARKPLDNGAEAPDFTGIRFPDSATVQLSGYRGRPVILDFWYMSCFPCIQAIPHLAEIQEKYRDEGLAVLGLNPYDNNDRSKKRLPEFMEYNKMNYDVLFVDKEVAGSYNVRGYPTFYLIGGDGKVAYSQVGFGEGIETIIDSVVNAHVSGSIP